MRMATMPKRAIVSSRTLSIILIIVLLFSGCTGANHTTNLDDLTDVSSSGQDKSSSETVIKSLADQISEWTEGQLYPGAYEKVTTSFILPSEPTSFVLESFGTIYAYGYPLNTNQTGREHMVRKYDGASEADVFLSEISSDSRLAGMYVGPDTIFMITYPDATESDKGNSSPELFLYTKTGDFRTKKKLTELLSTDEAAGSSLAAFTDNGDNLWIHILESGTLYCVSCDGKLSQKVSIPVEYQGGFMRGKEANELLTVLGTGSGLVFGKMNTETKVSENYVVEGLPGVQSVFPGTEYDALVMTEKSLYGVTLGKKTIVKELLVFTDLGIDGTILRSIQDYEDGSLSAILLERTSTAGERLSLSPRIKEAHNGLVLACLKSNEYLNYAVSHYNEKNPDNKVTIKQYYDKYAVDASETDALNRLNSDLIDGTAGDVICLDGISFAGSGKTLLDKGIFLDLYELMDNDPEFHKEDYFTDIFRVNETDGKLYRLVPFFSLNTKYGRVDDVGETTHIDESLLFETKPATSLFGPMYRRKDFIHDLLVFTLGDFREPIAELYDTAKMTRYVEIAGELRDYERYDGNGMESEGYNEAFDQRYFDLRDHVTRFDYNPWIQENAYLRVLRTASAEMGEPGPDWIPGTSEEEKKDFLKNSIGVKVTYSGFPVKTGCGSAVINRLTLAIPENTDSREEAWKFLKSTLSEEYQSAKKFSDQSIPVRKSVFDHYVERLIAYENQNDDPTYFSMSGARNPEEGWSIGYWKPILSQWMIDAFIRLLGDITLVDEVDPHVEAIVTEEITKYCDGRQTAEEAARNIAERVELYRDEQ